ncbi:MAG TPA: PilZ domain-containing protein [Vicinamibacteria bacterium]|nr:PilZ domain-containing protein [Vicinamibacteria bacterium]
MDPSERRRHQRLRIDGRMVGRATVLADFRIVALSEAGASLEMEVPMAMGSQCDLTLNLPHSSVDLRGRVVHLQAQNPNEQPPWLVGVDFEAMDAMDQALLQSFLDHERRRAL